MRVYDAGRRRVRTEGPGHDGGEEATDRGAVVELMSAAGPRSSSGLPMYVEQEMATTTASITATAAAAADIDDELGLQLGLLDDTLQVTVGLLLLLLLFFKPQVVKIPGVKNYKS